MPIDFSELGKQFDDKIKTLVGEAKDAIDSIQRLSEVFRGMPPEDRLLGIVDALREAAAGMEDSIKEEPPAEEPTDNE